jgi:hypothetical protein
MAQIAYYNDGNKQIVIRPTAEALETLTFEQIVEMSVPTGTQYTICDEADLPVVPVAVTDQQVNAERDRRTVSEFSFDGKTYDFDANSKANIAGAAQLAFMAIAANPAAANSVNWAGSDAFLWIAADNTTTEMTAATVINFGRAAAAHEKAHIFAARALKDMMPIPLNYTDDEFWP